MWGRIFLRFVRGSPAGSLYYKMEPLMSNKNHIPKNSNNNIRIRMWEFQSACTVAIFVRASVI